MIEQERIDAIKGRVDVAPFLRACGIDLTQNGKGLHGHCPFHDDKKTPSLSVTPGKNLWQCFGCGKGGDLIEFVRLFDQVDFTTAVQKLEAYLPGAAPGTPQKAVKQESPEAKPLTAVHRKLLARVIDFYHAAFLEDPRAEAYLKGRGITAPQIFHEHKIGLANGTLVDGLPAKGDTPRQLRDLGIINAKGHEHFHNCATFPLYDLNGHPAGIYGRRIEGEGPAHLYLPGQRQGLFNPRAVNSCPVVHLTESVLDSLTLINAGIENTVPCYGANGLTADHIQLLKQREGRVVYLCFDADGSGRLGAEKVKARLEKEKITVYAVKLPEGHDLNTFFLLTANQREAYEELLMTASGMTCKKRVTTTQNGQGGNAKVSTTDAKAVKNPDQVMPGDNLQPTAEQVSTTPAPPRPPADPPHPEPPSQPKTITTTDQPAPNNHQPATERKLLTRVVAFYQHVLTTDPRGLDSLKARGINGKEAIRDFGCGFANGTLRNAIPEDEEVRATLKKLGIINAKGEETLTNAITVPLHDESGAVVGLYGHPITPDSTPPDHFLPGPHHGLVNRQAAKRSATIFLTGSIIDGLTLYDQGFANVIPCHGPHGLTEDHLAWFTGKVKEAYVVFAPGETERSSALAVIEQLRKKAITAYPVELPEKDLPLYFRRHTPEEFEKLLSVANPATLERSDKVTAREQTLFRDEAHGFTVVYGNRGYQVKGIQKSETQLKATLKVAKDLTDPRQPFELTTIDLYSSRSRQGFAKLAAALFACAEELVKEDLGRILQLAEAWQPKEEAKATPEATEADQRRAMAFLTSPAIFQEILADFETLGVTGEETNKLVGYLAATSRKLADPLSVLIQSRSAAGKSTLQDAILSLIPDEEYIKYTRVTDQALFYKEEDSLMHKILAIEEAEGMGGAAYSIRNIQSAKKITVAATGKDAASGKMRTEEYTVNGPVSVMITTTQTDVDQETASRFIILTIDESRAMTESIHCRQREAETLAGLIKSRKQEGIAAKHHTAQRLLKNLSVVNPYSNYLTFPGHSLRSRRDHKKYLGLIRAVAFLHQHQREVKTITVEGQTVEYIEVTLADIEIANQLANDVLGQSMDELAKPSRTLLSLIYRMVAEAAEAEQKTIDQVFFTRRMVREYAGWTDWQIRTHIKQLEELEYIYARQGHMGKEYAYVLQYQGQAEESDRCCLALTPVAEIRKLMAEQGGAEDA